MHLKRFRAATMDEALRQIGEELGPEAVILHTKSIPLADGLSFTRRQGVEVMAALDGDPPKVSSVKCQVSSIDSTLNTQHSTLNTPTAEATAPTPPELEILRRELEQVKGMISGLYGRGPLPPDLSPALGRIYWSLLVQEVEEGVARRWVASVRDGLREAASSDAAPVSSVLAEVLAREVVRTPISYAGSGRRVVALVGPTGVGKTTTIAKLAAACHFREGKRVALITTDTYRIAGAQQLKSYAELIGLPFCVAPLPADLRRALTNDRDADVIFIDTVGRSARRQDQLEELATYARRDDGYEVHLVLSATTKRADLLQAVEGYRPLHFSSIIATKIDETATVGPMCEAALAAAVPISYFTTGQEVPDDIEEAQPLRLARRLVGESERREEG
ncbi:MAG: flagellar biosynthesis protein FlhF [Candidatus Methylomirabilota bacterium]|nr:MAG: flagellar biosynthesis protein FlhF [candidate division NC10 bacterium]